MTSARALIWLAIHRLLPKDRPFPGQHSLVRPLKETKTVVELTVMRGVPDLRKYAIRLVHARISNGSTRQYKVWEIIYERSQE
jgi:hypothetical protein